MSDQNVSSKCLYKMSHQKISFKYPIQISFQHHIFCLVPTPGCKAQATALSPFQVIYVLSLAGIDGGVSVAEEFRKSQTISYFVENKTIEIKMNYILS